MVSWRLRCASWGRQIWFGRYFFLQPPVALRRAARELAWYAVAASSTGERQIRTKYRDGDERGDAEFVSIQPMSGDWRSSVGMVRHYFFRGLLRRFGERPANWHGMR